MKKILMLIVLMAMVFTACGVDTDISDKMKSPNYQTNENTDENEKNSDKAYRDFLELIKKGKKPFELVEYIDKEIDTVSMDRADEMILALEETQKMYEDFYQHKFFNEDYVSDLHNAFTKDDNAKIIEQIENEKLKSLLKEVFDGGYKLISLEAYVYPIIDYSFLEKYNEFVSKDLNGYIDIMATESDKAPAADGALVVSWDEIAKRLLAIEEYTAKHTNFTRIEKLENLYYNHIVKYLIGLNNTPAYDYQTNLYKDEVIKSFNDLIENNKGTKTAELVKEYLDIIEENDYYITEEARDFTNKLYQENISSGGRYSGSINYKYTNDILVKLLPEDKGYKWIYNGFAEYGHEMTLEEIVKGDEQIEYLIKGKVADMSDGEAGKDEDYYNIDLKYIIKDAAIVQTKSENMMMDSDFDSLELIRAPLLKGNKWMQILVDKEGKDRYISCEITDVNEVGGANVYTVKYMEQDSDYYEIRMIEEGKGVVSFTKLWESRGESFEIGYNIYKEMSGY